jgi:glutamyl-tRNA synthetase
MSKVRVRFAPSPTGALHIGGIRTALYNYLFARQQGGDFILRIEDTDQVRQVDGAEEYIVEALRWAGLSPDEGPGFGGKHEPYRQSERREIYHTYAWQLVENGHGYLAFDTPEDLDRARQHDENFKYDFNRRWQMRNSLTMPPEEVDAWTQSGRPYVIRLKVPENEPVVVHDLVRGEVVFQGSELDDKVMLKSDGMPTYHLANVVDDHLMEITHVIRGEEWLPSTGHHVLLYRAFGWQDTMPKFAHLPLILKPDGQGKLSKRDGFRLGIPVFPLSWNGDTAENSFTGFREAGFLPEAMVNFMAFMGWNPGTEQEMFSLEAMVSAFRLENIGKSGARFDFDKAKWFNQQYIMSKPDAELAAIVRPWLGQMAEGRSDAYLQQVVGVMKERVTLLPDFVEKSGFFFKDVKTYDNQAIAKKWKPENKQKFLSLSGKLHDLPSFETHDLESALHDFMEMEGLKPGEVMPMLRIALTGSLQGPGVSEIMSVLGRETSVARLENGFEAFDRLSTQPN